MNAEQFIATALKYLGVAEDPRGSNSGPHIDDWLKLVGLKPGQPWCAAAACGWLYEANANAWPDGFHPSGGSLELLRRNPALVLGRGEEVLPGDIVVWAHGHGTGHAAVVTSTVAVAGVQTSFKHISGNTNSDGSHEGYEVAENIGRFDDVRIAGFIRAWKADASPVV